jgi:FAD synthetase
MKPGFFYGSYVLFLILSFFSHVEFSRNRYKRVLSRRFMRKRVVCAGTFDRLHTGHVEYLKKAKALLENSELVVIVARDKTSKGIKDKIPIYDEKTRLSRIRRLDFVDKVVLGYGKSRIIGRVVSLRPDLFALGYDQWAQEKWLAKELANKGLDVRIVRMPRFERKFL